jgi:hypothetical protein
MGQQQSLNWLVKMYEIKNKLFGINLRLGLSVRVSSVVKVSNQIL